LTLGKEIGHYPGVTDPEAMMRRNCPVCEHSEAGPFLQKGSLCLARCARCNMVYANPVEAELASGQFYDRLGVPFYLSPDKLESDYSPVRFERELRLFRSFCPQGAVLDVGCSTGAFLYQLTNRHPNAYEGVGMDVTSAALDHAESKGVRVQRGSFLDHDFGAQRFDAVTLWAVVEHLVQPKLFLSQAVRVLQPGGYCFILVPNLNSLAVRLLGGKYRYIMPDHVNYFTPATLARFAHCEPSFALVGAGSTHFNPLVILKDFRGGQARVADADRAQLLKRTTAYKQNPLLTPAKWLYRGVERVLGGLRLADNIYVVLRKKRL
jgi:2-polyprenyl-3-methyl-5-hydroxy-6-metoxy-1,4-benzoquinol methylase